MPTSTSVQSSLTDVPSILQPYITGAGGVLPTAQALVGGKSYEDLYGNALNQAGLAGAGRVASLSPMQQQIGASLQNMTAPGQFAQGTGAVNAGLGALGQATNAYGNIGSVNSNSYTGANVEQYMSPYMNNVVDVQKQAALRDAQMKLVGSNLASSRQGTYGGARNALMQSEADRNLQTQMGNIQATGSQQAFQNAQQQFNTSNLQSMDAQKANQAAQLAKAQGYGQLGQAYNQSGSALGALGTAQLAGQLDITKAQGAYGDLQRNVQQNQLDAQYNDLMAKQNQPLTNIEIMNNLARGVPLTQAGSTTTNTTPPPSFASQLAGTGLTGLSLYNMFGK